ncbi:hypothetical protein, partial [Massilia eurypsychrophila]
MARQYQSGTGVFVDASAARQYQSGTGPLVNAADGAAAGGAVNLAISNLASAGTLSTVNVSVVPPAAGVKNLIVANLADADTLGTVAVGVAPAQGTLTSDVFRAWGSSAALAGLTVPRVVALRFDGTVALNLANQVTNGAGRIVLASASLVTGTDYLLGTWNA